MGQQDDVEIFSHKIEWNRLKVIVLRPIPKVEIQSKHKTDAHINDKGKHRFV